MTIAYVGENTLVKQSGASSPASIPYPTVTSGNLLVLPIVTGNNANGTVTTPSGWTLHATATGGGGTWAAGDGPRRLTVFTKESDGTESGTFNVTWDSSGGAAVFLGQIHQFSKTTGSWAIASAAGDDTTAGTGAGTFVAVTGSLDMAPGDMVIGFAGGNSDGLINIGSIAASGITFGTYTEQQSDNQGGGFRAVYNVATAGVSSGTATTAVTLTYDALGDVVSGPGMAIRLREAGGGASDFASAAGVATVASLAGSSTASATASAAPGIASAASIAGAATSTAAASAAGGASTASSITGGATATAAEGPAAGAAATGALAGASTAVASFVAAAGVATASTLSSDLGASTFTQADGVATASSMAGSSLAVASFVPASGSATAGSMAGSDASAPAVATADGTSNKTRRKRRPVDDSPVADVITPAPATPAPAQQAPEPEPEPEPPAPEPIRLPEAIRASIQKLKAAPEPKARSDKAQKRLAKLELELQQAIVRQEEEDDDAAAIEAAVGLLLSEIA